MSATLTPTAAAGRQKNLMQIREGWKSVPPLGCKDEDARTFVENYINPMSRFRRWTMLRKARNMWFYRGRHWIKVNEHLKPGVGIYHFIDVRRRSRLSFPEPVDNRIGPGVDNEVARLLRREHEPNVRAERGEPALVEAAKLAKDILLHDMEVLHFGDIREELAFDMTVTGTCIARSYWDETVSDLSVVSMPDAAFCPACGEMFASALIPQMFAMAGQVPGRDEMGRPTASLAQPFQHTESLQDVEANPARRFREVRMTMCPTCAEPTELQPFAPSLEEAQEHEDLFGRPLGLCLPRGEGLIEAVSPFE